MGQNARTPACSVISADGALATGTIRNGDLTTRLEEAGSTAITIHDPAANALRCEEAFSVDGQWLITIVPSDKLNVLVIDRKTKAVHKQFSSDWNTFKTMPFEPLYQALFVGGFLDDGSIVIWRYVPERGQTDADASHVVLHLQRWSVDGELLSDQNLGGGLAGSGARAPLTSDNLHRLWLPDRCGRACYSGMSLQANKFTANGSLTLPQDDAANPIDVSQIKRFLSVTGERTAQQAILFDYTGKIDSSVNLPYIPNLFGPLVPDWYYAKMLKPSSDGRVAAIARTRVAWVLEDTDRDWGSEIVVLKLNPLSIVATIKTGKGGISGLAVDHHKGTVRVIGFWKDRWHDLRWDESRPGKWKEAATWPL